MTTCYFRIDPNETETQKISLPTDSIVFIGMDCGAVSGLYFPQLNLGDNTITEDNPFNTVWDATKKQYCRMSTSPQDMRPYLTNGMFLNKFWTGFEPFDKSFNALLYGYNRTIDGTKTMSATCSFQAADGTTYLLGTSSLSGIERVFEDGSLHDSGGQSLVVADEEGNYLGYAEYYYNKRVWVRNKRGNVSQTNNYICETDTILGNFPIYTIPFSFPFLHSTSLSGHTITNYAGEEIPLTSITVLATPVEVTGVPNVSYTRREQPVTFPMRITADERSYSYIQF